MVHQKGIAAEKYEEFYKSLYSMNTRLHWMYEKAKEDKTFRTDIPRRTVLPGDISFDDGNLCVLCGGIYLGVGRE